MMWIDIGEYDLIWYIGLRVSLVKPKLIRRSVRPDLVSYAGLRLMKMIRASFDEDDDGRIAPFGRRRWSTLIDDADVACTVQETQDPG